MRVTCVIAAAVAGLALLPVPAGAHHGGGLEWSRTVTGTASGTATDFDFKFPHISFKMDVEENGVKTSWLVTHNATPPMLRAKGWTRESIKPGDKVTVVYAPHVSRPHIVQMRSIEVNGKPLPLL